MIADVREKVERAVWGNALSQHGLFGRVAATLLRYLYAVLRDVFSGQLTLRAMSLVYTTLLSIVPLLAFSFSILKGLGVRSRVEEYLYGFLQPLGDKGRYYTDEILRLVDNINGTALAGFSLAFFLYTVISMVQKTEESFNYVWYVERPRSLSRRIVEYLFVLLIGPLSMFIALGMISALQSNALIEYLLDNAFVSQALVAFGKLLPYVIVCGVFTFLYMFMPNTRVRLGSAAVGGLAGGLLWGASSVLFATFVVGSASRNAIYAGFAIPISALIWIYLNWLMLLIGSQLAFYHQNPAYLRVGRRDPHLSNAMRERLALNIMLLVGREFRSPGGGVTTASLSRTLKIPGLTLAPVIERLEDAGFVTLTEREHLQPGREMSRIRLADVLAVVRVEGETGSYRSPVWDPAVEEIGGDLDNAVANTVGDRTLVELLDAAD